MTGSIPMAAQALAARDVLATHGKTFYVASFFLPPRMAQAATRLYHFCRYVDDIADTADDPLLAAQRLDNITLQLRHGHSADPIIQDAIALFHTYAIAIEIPMALLQGVRADLVLTQLPDTDALMRYCYQVAGTVGLMMATLLKATSAQAFYHAIDLGIAMQLTNICRDIQEDAQIKRVYVPQSLLQTPTNTDALDAIHASAPNVVLSMQQLLSKADQYYTSGYQGLAFLPLRARFAIFVAAKCYQQIGHDILVNPAKSLQQRVYVSGVRKAWIVVKSLAIALASPTLWLPCHTHQKPLHQSLTGYPMVHE